MVICSHLYQARPMSCQLILGARLSLPPSPADVRESADSTGPKQVIVTSLHLSPLLCSPVYFCKRVCHSLLCGMGIDVAIRVGCLLHVLVLV